MNTTLREFIDFLSKESFREAVKRQERERIRIQVEIENFMKEFGMGQSMSVFPKNSRGIAGAVIASLALSVCGEPARVRAVHHPMRMITKEERARRKKLKKISAASRKRNRG
jgi:hypothetical protein